MAAAKVVGKVATGLVTTVYSNQSAPIQRFTCKYQTLCHLTGSCKHGKLLQRQCVVQRTAVNCARTSDAQDTCCGRTSMYSTCTCSRELLRKYDIHVQRYSSTEGEKRHSVSGRASKPPWTLRKMNAFSREASETKKKMKEKVADKVKDMKENILTIPNLLSTTRLALSPVLGYLVVHEFYTLGVCLFTVAGVTDLLDGFIARNFKNQQSVLGSIIDPLADKCLVTILTLSLTVSGLIPVPLTVLMVGRDIGLVGSVAYLRYWSLMAPRTLSRFFDVTHATVQLKPTMISKLNTAVQLSLVGFTLAAPVFHYVDHLLLHALWYITASTTVLSSLSYLVSKDAFKFLRK